MCEYASTGGVVKQTQKHMHCFLSKSRSNGSLLECSLIKCREALVDTLQEPQAAASGVHLSLCFPSEEMLML
jgi:hypothetical protein